MKHLLLRLIAITLILISIITLTGCFLLPEYDPEMPLSSVLGSPLLTGEWDGNTFKNNWSGINFELPQGFLVSDYEMKIPGEYALDFLLYHDDFPELVISLAYFDVTQGESRVHTAEDYLTISKNELLNSPDRNFFFDEGFGSVVIGDWKYAVTSGTFVDIGNDTQIVYHIDRYAYRWVGTMVVIVAMYSNESAGTVNTFLNSIEQSWD